MSFISVKPQFTQGALPFCSLNRVCLISVLSYIILAVLALFAAHQMADWFNLFIVHLLWLQPTILLSFPILCGLEKHTLNLNCNKPSLKNTLVLLFVPCVLAFGFAVALEGFSAKSSLLAPLLTPLLKYQALALTSLLSTLLIYWRTKLTDDLVGVSPELEEADLRHLGAAIRPHFFFNALNAVMGLIRSEPKQAEAVLQDTAELFRSVMMQHEQRLVSLATELETCEQYTRIEQARLAHRLRLNWQVDTALLGVSVPPFSLQPLIENAIRHGIEPLVNGGEVVIVVQRQSHSQNLLLRVSNPVISELTRYSATRAKQHNGIALENINARLKLMYDQAATFEHGVVNGHYEAEIVLPLEFA